MSSQIFNVDYLLHCESLDVCRWTFTDVFENTIILVSYTIKCKPNIPLWRTTRCIIFCYSCTSSESVRMYSFHFAGLWPLLSIISLKLLHKILSCRFLCLPVISFFCFSFFVNGKRVMSILNLFDLLTFCRHPIILLNCIYSVGFVLRFHLSFMSFVISCVIHSCFLFSLSTYVFSRYWISYRVYVYFYYADFNFCVC